MAIVVVLFGAISGCSQGSRSGHPSVTRQSHAAVPAGKAVAGVLFVAASATVREECQQAADAVSYAVPCPTMLPAATTATPGYHGCKEAIVEGSVRLPRDCGGTEWDGWITGSSQTSSEHLVLQGAPRVVRDPALAIDGPGMFPGSRVQPRGEVAIGGEAMQWYYVPPLLNQGSAFQGHLVLVWTASRHTYAYGFHVVTTFADARALDLELVSHLVVIKPRRTH